MANLEKIADELSALSVMQAAELSKIVAMFRIGHTNLWLFPTHRHQSNTTASLSQFDLCFIVIAIASGATVLSHVNDSGFWLVGRFLEMDEKTTLKTWTVMETLIGVVGFAFAAIGSIIL